MSNVQLTKSSSSSDLKRYFTAVLDLSNKDNLFPINLDEVWMLAYERKDKALNALRKHFFEGEDFYLTQMGKVVGFNGLQNGIKVECFISVSCMEYFIARKVRPVFEVYRQVFHHTAKQKQNLSLTLPQDFEEALTQLLAQVRMNKQLELANKTLHEDIQTQQNINNLLQGENDVLRPKGRIYDQVMQSADLDALKTTSSVANEIGMSGQKLNRMLIACGIIYKQQDGDYLFTSEYIGWGLGKVVSTVVNDKGMVRTYIKWNTRGRAYIHALYDTNWDKRRAWHLLKESKDVNEA